MENGTESDAETRQKQNLRRSSKGDGFALGIMGPADPLARRGRIMSRYCRELYCEYMRDGECMATFNCRTAQAHKPDQTSAGPVGSSGLLVPASPAPTARHDRFTAGPIGARPNRFDRKPGGARCHAQYVPCEGSGGLDCPKCKLFY